MIRQSDPPRFYAVHLVKSGPNVPVKVWYGQPNDPVTGEPLDRSLRWNVILNGEHVEPHSILMEVGNVGYIKGDKIDEAEYQFLLQDRAWAIRNQPGAPEAKPREAIDHLKGDLLF